MRLKRMQYKALVSVAQVPELNFINVIDDGLEIEASVKLSELLSVLRRVAMDHAAHEVSSCKSLIEQIRWFAGTQIKNVASVGGNICSPISDLNPLWMAAEAKFKIIDSKGNIRTTLAENFFQGYRKVTSEAEYADDMPMSPHGFHAVLILSRKPHAGIVSIDDSGSKSSRFAVIFFAKDVPGDNRIGPVFADEELFASELLTCVGQLAARRFDVEYEELPPILSIKDALKSRTFHPGSEKQLTKADVDFCFQSGQFDRVIEGEVQVGGQEHFYLEPQRSIVWTMDGGNEVHMISSTQAPQMQQKYVSHVLGLPMSKVVCKTKRIGGGFGGKEMRSTFVAAAASVPSYLLNQPVKIMLDRDVDMMIIGQRHSFFGKYKVGFTNEGKALTLDLEIYNNAGNSYDLSLAVLERAIFHLDNVYEIPNVWINGKVCFTDFPSNTAFRGFGDPQGTLITENWIQRSAVELNKSPEEIREKNFQKEGSMLHYGQKLEHCTLPQLWSQLKLSCDFPRARAEVDKFNIRNCWNKR